MSEPANCACGRPLALLGERLRGTCNGCDLLAGSAAVLTDAPAGWPLHSDALAVHPDQVPAEAEYVKRRGVPTRFDGRGRPVFENRRHRRAYLKAIGAVDRDSFTGY